MVNKASGFAISLLLFSRDRTEKTVECFPAGIVVKAS